MKQLLLVAILGVAACRSKANTGLEELTALKNRLCACKDPACKAEVLALIGTFYKAHAEVEGTGEQSNQAAFLKTGISLCAKFEGGASVGPQLVR